jgi:hypothetical protein
VEGSLRNINQFSIHQENEFLSAIGGIGRLIIGGVIIALYWKQFLWTMNGHNNIMDCWHNHRKGKSIGMGNNIMIMRMMIQVKIKMVSFLPSVLKVIHYACAGENAPAVSDNKRGTS